MLLLGNHLLGRGDEAVMHSLGAVQIFLKICIEMQGL